MNRKGIVKQPFKVFTAIVLAITLIFSVNMPCSPYVTGATDFSIEPESRVADPPTSEKTGFVDLPRVHDGRIWTDKTVAVNDGPGADDFTITLSALSQSIPETSGYAIPADTVFIIDVSYSMFEFTVPGTSRTRIDVLVESLNEAIGILQDANPLNRVAVVAYGGRNGGFARVENILNLGRYSPNGGKFFNLSSPTTVSVVATPNTSAVPGAQVRSASILVQGSTPTQWGIYEGASLLAQEPLTTAEVTVYNEIGDDAKITVTRRPNIVLMTDGEPTMGWPDYTFPSSPGATGPTGIQLVLPGVFYGDGINGEMGLSILTVLTASHMKKLVYGKYFPGTWDPDHGIELPPEPPASVGFYTVSLGTNSNLVRATMNPEFSAAAVTAPIPAPPAGDTNSGNMRTLLDAFVSSPSITFDAQRRQSFNPSTGAVVLWETLSPVVNTVGLAASDLNYATQYFPATDLASLKDAFISITNNIQGTSLESVTKTDDKDADFEGYLVFSDVLGEYMTFRGITEFKYNSKAYSRAGFAAAIIGGTEKNDYIEILFKHMTYPEGSPTTFTKPMAASLVESNILSGHLLAENSLKYYADAKRDYVGDFFKDDGTGTYVEAAPPASAAAIVEIFPMYGQLSNPDIPPSETTDLKLIVFHVVTSIKDDTTFTEIFDPSGAPTKRIMNKDDQMIRWYIPANLIPLRTVEDTKIVTGNVNPVRISYRVGLDEERVAGLTYSYFDKNRAIDNDKDAYFYTNRHNVNENDVTLAFYQPNELNPFYQAGTDLRVDRGTVKEENVTETAPHVTLNRHLSVDSDRVDLHWLGNNGRLTVFFEDPPPAPPTPPSPPTEPPTRPRPPTPTDPPEPHEPPTNPPTHPPTTPPDPPTNIPNQPPPTDGTDPPPPSIPRTGETLSIMFCFYIILLVAGLMYMGRAVLQMQFAHIGQITRKKRK